MCLMTEVWNLFDFWASEAAMCVIVHCISLELNWLNCFNSSLETKDNVPGLLKVSQPHMDKANWKCNVVQI